MVLFPDLEILSDTFNIGFIIGIIAIIGFIFYDVYTRFQYVGIPPTYIHQVEVIFHYISRIIISGVFILWGFFIFILIGLYWLLSVFIKMNIIDERTATILLQYSFAVFFSGILVIFIVAVAFGLGILQRITNKRWLRVKLVGNTPIEFPRIICETNEFIYFENNEDMRSWRAINKENIEYIESFIHESRFGSWWRAKNLLPRLRNSLRNDDIISILFGFLILLLIIFGLIFS